MNAPFKPEPTVEEILASASVSISRLKANPAAVVAEARYRQVAVLSRNKPVAYVISPEVWAYLCEIVADLKIGEEVRERLENKDDEIEVAIDNLV